MVSVLVGTVCVCRHLSHSQPITNPDVQPVHFSNPDDEAFAMEAKRAMRPEASDQETGIRLVKVCFQHACFPLV